MFQVLVLSILTAQPLPPLPLPELPPLPVEVAELPALPPMKPAPVLPDYFHGYAAAKASGAVCVVFVNAPERKIPGAECYTSHPLTDGIDNVILVTVPARSIRKYLPATATDAAIERAVQEVSRVRDPFDHFNRRTALREARAVARFSVENKGPWVESIAFPVGMVRYRPSKFTQEIAVTTGLDNIARDRITPVDRANLLIKWRAPGGMEEIDDWDSDLYKYVPVSIRPFIADINVFNGTNFQPNRGWRRTYPDGTQFHDVLSKDGVVFEHRVREKVNGAWESFVAYKDVSARPAGYVGLSGQRCQSCHVEAGTGGYAVGLVPGSDTVISDPFPALEL